MRQMYRFARYYATERRTWYEKLPDTEGIRYRVTERRIWYEKLPDTEGIRYRVTERRIWYKMLSNTEGIRYRVTERRIWYKMLSNTENTRYRVTEPGVIMLIYSVTYKRVKLIFHVFGYLRLLFPAKENLTQQYSSGLLEQSVFLGVFVHTREDVGQEGNEEIQGYNRHYQIMERNVCVGQQLVNVSDRSNWETNQHRDCPNCIHLLNNEKC